MSRSITEFITRNLCVDPWRFYNPQNKVYSFFHKSIRHILVLIFIFFFIDSSLSPKVKSVLYHPIVISDHAPLTIDMQLSVQPRYSSPWRLNSLLLSDEKFVGFISASIDDFMATNQVGEVSYPLLWETLKAYLRGQIISYSAHLNRLHTTKIRQLTSDIFNIDQQLASSPSQVQIKSRLDLQAELDLILTNGAEQLLLHSHST